MCSCAQFIIKYVLFAVNLVFALGGLALLVLGVVVQVRVSDVITIANVDFSVAPISSMVVGSVIFFIAFFGCCGAIKENRCYLITYAVFMMVLLITKLAIGIVIFVNKDSIVEDVPNWLNNTFNNNRNDFYEIQASFQCCGTTGPDVYLPGALHASCCTTPPCNVNNAFAGCNTIVKDFFNTFSIAIGTVLLFVAGVELVAAIFGFCLSRHINEKRTVQVVN